MLNTNLIQECIIVEALQIAVGAYLASAHKADMCNQPSIAETFREKAQRVRTLKALIEHGDITKQRTIT